MDMLRDLGVSESAIGELESIYGDAVIKCLVDNSNNVKMIYSYMKNIGIDTRDSILVIHLDLFLHSYRNFINLLTRKNVYDFVQILNNDPNAIYELYE